MRATEHAATTPATGTELAADERTPDRLDWPAFFGRRWWGGLPSGLLDPDWFVADRPQPMRVEQRCEGDVLVVLAELPGLDPAEDVEIGLEGRHLTIDATREETFAGDDERHRSEFRSGRFRRVIPLPDRADTAAATAGYTDGILEVRVPLRAPRAGPTQVPITHA